MCGAGPKDAVNHPSHYADEYPFEVIDLIELVLTSYGEQIKPFEAYCLGNELKYRLRAGFKNDAAEDIAKALKYRELRKMVIQHFVPTCDECLCE